MYPGNETDTQWSLDINIKALPIPLISPLPSDSSDNNWYVNPILNFNTGNYEKDHDIVYKIQSSEFTEISYDTFNSEDSGNILKNDSDQFILDNIIGTTSIIAYSKVTDDTIRSSISTPLTYNFKLLDISDIKYELRGREIKFVLNGVHTNSKLLTTFIASLSIKGISISISNVIK